MHPLNLDVIVDNYKLVELGCDINKCTPLDVQLYRAACEGNNGYLCKPIEHGCDMNKTE